MTTPPRSRSLPAPAERRGSQVVTRRAPRFRPNWAAVLLVLPALLVLGLVLFYPIGVAVYSGFFDMQLMNLGGKHFIGLGNYRQLLQSPAFWASLRVTVVYTVGVVVGTYAIGLLTALLLNRPLRGRVVFRMLVVLPWAVPQVVSVLIWSWMLDANYGVVNYFLRAPHLIGENLQWLVQPRLALVSVLLVTIWTLYPVAMVMLLAGLQSIPHDLYEAAAVDGAGRIKQFQHVTWPGLAPVNIVLILLLTLLAFTRVVTIIYVMTGGGPASATETLPIQTYLQAFKFFHMGYASAVGTVVLLIAIVFSLVYMAATSRLYREI